MLKFITDKFEYKENYKVSGLTKELQAIYIANYFEKNRNDVIVLTSTLYEANTYFKLLQTYDEECLFFPMDDFLTSVALAVSPDLKIKRLETLEKITNEKSKPHLIVTSLMGYLKFLPDKQKKSSLLIELSNKNISREIILERLEELGYRKDSLVTATGEYAVRGFIIDVFPIQNDLPIRIEFFGEEIDSIKTFDENTQRSIEEISKIEIQRYNETLTENPNSLLDYLKNPTVFLIDETQLKTNYTNLQNEIFEYKVHKELNKETKFMYELEELNPHKLFKIEGINYYKGEKTLAYNSKEIINFNGDFAKIQNFCRKETKKNTIIFALENQKQKNVILNILEEAKITNEDRILDKQINVIERSINAGFIFNNFIVISPYDIENALKKEIKYKNTIKIGRKIKTFTDLNAGDYIVHETHGIGIYRGLKTLTRGEFTKDYIELEYLGKDKVYVPVENIDKLFKYNDGIGQTPKLSKLNSISWAKKKRETRARIKDISEELIELYRSRNKIKGIAYKDFEEEIKFALSFPFTLTGDQEKTIKEIDIDLKNAAPMDRLLCGDVGYGKTEVAFRAMFKTVINGFQVAYLCPTTILSKQQYNNALERFKDYPIRIELVNRYVTQKKINVIMKDLEAGKIDIVIGTHKLLNDNIKYKQLGLLVIDEEQRFGVTHKEKIKKLKNDVNVLTLSATPIPRTLKLAMSGLRSLSVLDTPPINRYPIQTYVIEENELIIKDAIYKELTRKGQIFILINNIEALEKVKNTVSKLVPEASVITGHGQMSSEQLNSIMEKFIEKEYDILICTTIIETGIDIPNVNTIIILDAQLFGLSQLYQIRGRVGRSDKIAYAYLMYDKTKILTETAMKRLESKIGRAHV